jgi:hypothetical protein
MPVWECETRDFRLESVFESFLERNIYAAEPHDHC